MCPECGAVEPRTRRLDDVQVQAREPPADERGDHAMTKATMTEKMREEEALEEAERD